MKDNFCPSSEISVDYSCDQIEIGIYEIIFEGGESPWPEYKYFVRVGGGWRGYATKREAKKYYNQD